MKSERRHELQENELAGAIGEYVEKIQPYSKTLVGVVAVLAALIFSGFYFAGQKKKNSELSWEDYFHASANMDAEGLQNIANRYAGTSAAAWSFQSAGDIYLVNGARMIYSDREAAIEEFSLAQESFEDARDAAKNDMLRQRAIFGIAQSHEALEEYADAEKYYKQIINDWPETAVAETAKERMDFLNLKSTRDFYSWFIQQSPAIRQRQPLGGVPGETSQGLAIDNVLGEGPDLEPPDGAIDVNAEVEDAFSGFVEGLNGEQPVEQTVTGESVDSDLEEKHEQSEEQSVADETATQDTAVEVEEVGEKVSHEATGTVAETAKESSEATADTQIQGPTESSTEEIVQPAADSEEANEPDDTTETGG